MPTLTRYIVVVLILGAAGYGALWALANLVEATPHEIIIRVPNERIDNIAR